MNKYVNYYRERGISDSLIRGITGHKDLSAYGDYAVTDLAAQAGADAWQLWRTSARHPVQSRR